MKTSVKHFGLAIGP